MVTCANPTCQNQFQPKSHIHKYCQKSCNASVRRSNNWNWLRKLTMKRDNNSCVECGISGVMLHCHHIQPICMNGTNELDNLEMRCVKCHHKVHRSYREWRDYEVIGETNIYAEVA